MQEKIASLSEVPPSIWAEMHEQCFHETGNPVDLLEAFWMSHAAKMCPSQSVLDSLAKAFQEFLDARGRKTLDQVLGFKRGKRKDSWFVSRESAHLGAAVTMFWLICLFEITVKQAARMVAARRQAFISNGELRFPENQVRFAPKTLEQHYSRRWKKKYHLNEDDVEAEWHPNRREDKWTDDKKRQFLNSFPRNSLPRTLKTYFSRPINCRVSPSS